MPELTIQNHKHYESYFQKHAVSLNDSSGSNNGVLLKG